MARPAIAWALPFESWSHTCTPARAARRFKRSYCSCTVRRMPPASCRLWTPSAVRIWMGSAMTSAGTSIVARVPASNSGSKITLGSGATSLSLAITARFTRKSPDPRTPGEHTRLAGYRDEIGPHFGERMPRAVHCYLRASLHPVQVLCRGRRPGQPTGLGHRHGQHRLITAASRAACAPDLRTITQTRDPVFKGTRCSPFVRRFHR